MNKKFTLVSRFTPKGDQKEAIRKLVLKIKNQKFKDHLLFGATGTGKTFTIANVIEKIQQKVLVISHNKTLAIQLFCELKNFFPENKVEYFISPFDFYRPEAYLPNKDLYIDKSVKWNLDIKKMRMNTLNSLLHNDHVIVVATVAAIFGVLNPSEYANIVFNLQINAKIKREHLLTFLINSGYKRKKILDDGSQFMVKGSIITIALPNGKDLLQLQITNDQIIFLHQLRATTFLLVKKHQNFNLYPGQEYVVQNQTIVNAISEIKNELQEAIKNFKLQNKFVEEYRIRTRTLQNLEDLQNFGFCNGIENYSLHFDQRKIGEPPYTLLDYFTFNNQKFLTIIDESHITIPQIRAMYLSNLTRKQSLVDYGFRLKTALDNRPLNFFEFQQKLQHTIYVSATPGDYELEKSKQNIVEQIIRPTNLLDPKIILKPKTTQIISLLQEIKSCVAKKERVFVLTLTIKMAEDLTSYFQERGIKIAYLHSKLKTYQRTKILINLRKGIFDVVVGINLLREGLDIPEIALVAILDADQRGFLRGQKSLIQMIGRASRNINGRVILYQDTLTKEIKNAILETTRRRNKQIAYNLKNNLQPQTINKPIDDIFLDQEIGDFYQKIQDHKNNKIDQFEKKRIIIVLQKRMDQASKNLDFELAAKIRDMIFDLMIK